MAVGVNVDPGELRARVVVLERVVNPEAAGKRLAEIAAITASPGFWDDNARAQAVLREQKRLKSRVSEVESFASRLDDVEVMAQLAEEEEDETARAEVASLLQALERDVAAAELRLLLSEPDDQNDAILTIHPGAGGTESQDWAEMLYRMYLRWFNRRDFAVEELDRLAGDTAGLKSVTVEVRGDYAYGYLKGEAGVHRLVRISPFDAAKRRHTSFASVFVYPAVAEDIEVDVNPKDLRVDTFRAQGAGGQHVNKTSSAVRITHEPTGIVVQCQSERSQYQNKENAMKVLRARLYELAREERRAQMNALAASKQKIEWGSQIRSYVFQPYTMVKDHRTGHETPNVDAVMDGQIDDFIKSYLTHARTEGVA